MKITIESDDNIVSCTTGDVALEHIVQHIKGLLVANQFSPTCVDEEIPTGQPWFEENTPLFGTDELLREIYELTTQDHEPEKAVELIQEITAEWK